MTENKTAKLTQVFDKIKALFGEEEAKNYYIYLTSLNSNTWLSKFTATDLIQFYVLVKADRLILDGKHVTLTPNGVSYDYVAYKNKMLAVYPETKLDINLVYKTDVFEFKKLSGVVHYNHTITNPFERKDEDIIGGYVVIKNSRGEFLTLLDKADFEKHKKVAKTKNIWNDWYAEMCLKTLMKKSIKMHFDDEFEIIEKLDNNNYDLSLLDEQSSEEKRQNKLDEIANKYKDI